MSTEQLEDTLERTIALDVAAMSPAMRDRYRAALAQAEQPVAWRLRWVYPATGQPTSWFVTTDYVVARQKEQDGLEVQPLYAHPPAKREAGETAPPESHVVGLNFGSHGSATAMFDVIAERLRQQEKEGLTPKHDDAHKDGELAQAAAVYAHPFKIILAERRDEYERGNNAWPWYESVDVSGGRGDCPCWGWRPAWLKKTDRRRDLVKAAALIIAEIERLDRVAIATTEGSDNG